MLGSDEMVVLGFSSGLVVFPSVVDGFLVFGLLLPGDVLGAPVVVRQVEVELDAMANGYHHCQMLRG